MRVNQYLAWCGLGSRRSVERLVLSGRVQLNGQTITNLATNVQPTDHLTVDGQPLTQQNNKVYILLNKPDGVVSTTHDPQGRPTVLDVLYQNPKQYATLLNTVRLYPVGRLDYHTSGLLILTNDGALTKLLTHPSHQTSKVYHATVSRPVSEKELTALANGVVIDGHKTAPAQVTFLNRERTKLSVTIHEGRNRQVRKMFAVFQIDVKALTRVQEGKLKLGNLASGDWKFVRKSQII